MNTKPKTSDKTNKSRELSKPKKKQKIDASQQENNLASRSKELFETPAGIQFLESAPSLEAVERHFNKAESEIGFLYGGVESSFPESLEKLSGVVREIAERHLPEELRESYIEIETAFLRAMLTLGYAEKRNKFYNKNHPTVLLLQAYVQWLMKEKLQLVASLYDEEHRGMYMGMIGGFLVDLLRVPLEEREDFIARSLELFDSWSFSEEQPLSSRNPGPPLSFDPKKATTIYRTIFRERFGRFPTAAEKMETKILSAAVRRIREEFSEATRRSIREGIKKQLKQSAARQKVSDIKSLAKEGRKKRRQKSLR